MLFYSNNLDLLPPKPKLTLQYLKQVIQEFHRKYVLAPADKAANNVAVVWRLYHINTLIQKLGSTKSYERISTDERSIINTHYIDITAKFAVSIKEKQDRLPTLYWLPKLHKRPYKARFIANSSSCTTTVLSKLLTSKAVVPVLVLLFVALWFILRSDLLYVFLCVILFLCFLVLLVLRLPRLGKRERILVLFIHLFGLCLFRFVGFLFPLGSGKGCGLSLWYSLDFSRSSWSKTYTGTTALERSVEYTTGGGGGGLKHFYS